MWDGRELQDTSIVAVVEGVGDAYQGGKGGDALASTTTELGKLLMGGTGQGAAVVAGNTGYLMALLFGEIRQIGLFDEAEGVLMMAAALDHHAGVVQEGRTLQQAQSMVIQLVQWSGCIKELSREPLYL